MKRTTLAAVAVIAAAGLTLLAAPTAATATDVPECTRGQVASTWHGDGSFTLSTQNGAADCGVWLTSYTGVDRQLMHGDYSHHQIAREWAWAQLTAAPTLYSVALPSCDNVQVDAYTGPLQLDLPHGDLGSAWIAGGVIERPELECQPEPTPPIVTEPPVVVTPEPTETPSPTTPAPEPSDEPTEQPTEPSTPPITLPEPEPSTEPYSPVSPVDSTPATELPEPSAAVIAPNAAPTSSPTARLASVPADSLAYTGSESSQPLALIAGATVLAGVALAVGGGLYRRRMDKRESA